MAEKNTYIYKVSMGKGNDVDEVAFCYARNKIAAREGYREIFRENKYDRFNVVMFGEADYKKHPEWFKPMPREEVDYVLRNKLADADAYAQRKIIEQISESEEA